MKTFYIAVKAFYVILLFGLVFGTISCADKIETPPTTTSYSGMIIYTKYDNLNQSLGQFGTVVDTSGKYQYSFDQSKLSAVCDAQGGKILYFTGASSGSANTIKLIVANSDNSSQHIVYAASTTQDLEGLSPVLSPDGSLVAFATLDSAATTSNLWIANTDGSDKRLISGQFNIQSRPCFSEDSKKIVYYTSSNINDSHGQCTLEIANADLTGINTICSVSNGGIDGSGRISWRNGKNEIAFVDDDVIFNININGSSKVMIDQGATPMWSPDGSQLAYCGMNTDIILTSDLGLLKTNITNTDVTFEAYPQWSPDGKKILCMSWEGDFDHNPTSLKLIDASASGSSRVIITPGIFGYFLK